MNQSMDELPEPIIQHILSFLTTIEAARTTLLSNSWRKAWFTQPNLTFDNYDNDSLEFATQTFERCVDKEEGVSRSVGLGLINLHNLTRLELVYVEFDTLFFGNLSSSFPSLKDLTLHTYSSSGSQDKVIRISSRSLERLNFAQANKGLEKKRVRFKFDVPSIRWFTYKSSVIPLLSFKSTSREWESRVSIDCEKKNLSSLWFCRLSKFLTKLRRSKISHLSLKFERCRECFHYEPGEIEGLRSSRLPRVENLTVDIRELPNLNCYPLFDGLFQVCRPKLITQYLSRSVHQKANRDYFLCKVFLARQGGTSESHFLYYGLRDLEEVNVEIFGKEVAVWRLVPLKSLLDGKNSSTSWATDVPKIRFQLKWKREPHGAFC